MNPTLRKITPSGKTDAIVQAPPSKSYTIRAFLLGALAEGATVVKGALMCDDTRVMLRALEALGYAVEKEESAGTVRIGGRGGQLPAGYADIDAGEAGAVMRFILPILALGKGTYHLKGSQRLSGRPLGELADALDSLHVEIEDNQGKLPVTVCGDGRVKGGRVKLDSKRSSQFVSALLMAAPCYEGGLAVELTGPIVSAPYIDMSLAAMEHFGVRVEKKDNVFTVPQAKYKAAEFAIEPDASSGAFMLAAAAVTGGSITIDNAPAKSRQGDWIFAELLGKMGCKIERGAFGLKVSGGELKAIECDLSQTPDLVPPLAAAAVFAKGKSVVTGIEHLRYKESDRIAVLARELSKIGVKTTATDNSIEIEGPPAAGAEIDPDGDHRIAMAFSIIGLALPGISIKTPECVDKSYPEFFSVLERISKHEVKPK
jgi:3-phosphoshikimate 1-carboxyvinyltransferase